MFFRIIISKENKNPIIQYKFKENKFVKQYYFNDVI